MTVTAVFDSAIPAPANAKFTNGERALALAGLIGSEAVGTYYLAKRVNLPAGVYSMKAILSPGGSITIDGVTVSGSGLLNTQIDIGAGERRIDITLTKSNSGQACYAAFVLFRSDSIAYRSNAAGWVFDTIPVATLAVPAADDPRLALPVWSVLPNWANGVTERIAYLTDILTSETGAEQRRTLRQYPRRSIEASFMRDNVLRARMDNFMVGVGVKDMLVPLWHEQYRTTTAVLADELFHQFPTTGDTLAYREFAAGDVVLITNGDPLEQELVVVDSADASTGLLAWRKRPAKTWPAGVRLIPVKVGMISDKASMSAPVDRVGSMQIRFDLKEPDRRFAGDWGYCAPLWRFKIDRGTALTLDYERNSYTLDSELGPVQVTNPGDRAFVNSRFAVQVRGRQNMYELRQFIAAARGKAVRFYAPSFTRDIFPVSNLAGASFDCTVTGFAESMPAPQWARKIIAIVFNDGSPTIYRNIIGVTRETPSGKPVERFTLDVALPAIALYNIERIQFVVPSRFDQDSFEFAHLVDGSAAVQSTFVTRAVDGTGMASIEC